MAASLRYDDGKTLKGIGTLASKSRLTKIEGEPFDSATFQSAAARTTREEARDTMSGASRIWS